MSNFSICEGKFHFARCRYWTLKAFLISFPLAPSIGWVKMTNFWRFDKAKTETKIFKPAKIPAQPDIERGCSDHFCNERSLSRGPSRGQKRHFWWFSVHLVAEIVYKPPKLFFTIVAHQIPKPIKKFGLTQEFNSELTHPPFPLKFEVWWIL